MAVKKLSQLSGKVKLQSSSNLDSDRYDFLSLEQAEPNFGVPESDGALFSSLVDGTRSFTSKPTLSGLLFRGNSLDSVAPGSRFVLGIKDPRSLDSVGLINVNDILGDSTNETLQSVTNRGNTTTRNITIRGLSVTNMQQDNASQSVLVLTSTDSVAFRPFSDLDSESDTLQTVTSRGDSTNVGLTFTGGLTLNNLSEISAEQTVLVLQPDGVVGVREIPTATLQQVTTQGDSTSKEIVTRGVAITRRVTNETDNVAVFFADSESVDYAVSNNGASNYIIDGENNPTLTLIRGSTYDFNLSVSGHPFYIKTAAVTGTGSTYDFGVENNGAESGTLTFRVPDSAPETLYYICQFHSGMVGTLQLVDGGAIGTRNLSAALSADTLQTITARGDSTDRAITIGGLSISQLDSDPNTNQILVYNRDTDSVGVRSFESINVVETDTLQTVTDRGDSTSNAITIANLQFTRIATDTNFSRVLVLTDEDSVRVRTFTSLVDSEADTLATVTARGATTTVDTTFAKIVADSVQTSGLFDGNNVQLVIYDSAGAVLWGA